MQSGQIQYRFRFPKNRRNSKKSFMLKLIRKVIFCCRLLPIRVLSSEFRFFHKTQSLFNQTYRCENEKEKYSEQDVRVDYP